MSAALTVEPASTKKYTADDLLMLPDGDRFELVDGELVESKLGAVTVAMKHRLVQAERQ